MIGTLALEASLSTGEIMLTGTLITIESSGLNCNKSVDNLSPAATSPCPVSAGSFCGAQGAAACLQPRCRGSGEHFPLLTHSVYTANYLRIFKFSMTVSILKIK